MEPQIGDLVLVRWPGSGLRQFYVTNIRLDEDGVNCAVFGEGSTVGAEAVDSFRPVPYPDDGGVAFWVSEEIH